MTSHIFKDKYPRVLGSSIDPYQLSMTIKGVLTAIVPLVLVFAPMFNWTVNKEDFENLSTGIEAVIVAVTSLVSTALIVAGVIRKILVGLNLLKPRA